jgi:hypothetical protein
MSKSTRLLSILEKLIEIMVRPEVKSATRGGESAGNTCFIGDEGRPLGIGIQV